MKKMWNKIARFFYRKRIVYSRTYKPAIMVRAFITPGGDKYIRVAFTNRLKREGTYPMTDIPIGMVIGIKTCYSKFDVWLWSLIGVEAKNENKPIKKLKRK